MIFKDISRQNGRWVNQCKLFVTEVGLPVENEHGISQAIEAKDSYGVQEVLYVRCQDLQGVVEPTEIGEQCYKVRYKNDMFQAVPEDAVKQTTDEPDDKWNEIMMKKSRRKIVCACVSEYDDIDVVLEDLSNIEKLARYTVYGIETNDK